MSESTVLDSSAILAYLHREPGGDLIAEAIRSHATWVSSVNVCEVIGKLVDEGMATEPAREAVESLRLSVADFDMEAAVETALLKARTKSIGASLGDRACLALAAQRLGAGEEPTVLTSDRAWARLQWPFKITLVR